MNHSIHYPLCSITYTGLFEYLLKGNGQILITLTEVFHSELLKETLSFSPPLHTSQEQAPQGSDQYFLFTFPNRWLWDAQGAPKSNKSITSMECNFKMLAFNKTLTISQWAAEAPYIILRCDGVLLSFDLLDFEVSLQNQFGKAKVPSLQKISLRDSGQSAQSGATLHKK